MTNKGSDVTYKELIEILLSAAATIMADKDLNAIIEPLKDEDVASLIYILENIHYVQEQDDEIDTFEYDIHNNHCCKKHGCKYGDLICPVVFKDAPGVERCEYCDGEIIDAATTEYMNTVDRPIPNKGGKS